MVKDKSSDTAGTRGRMFFRVPVYNRDLPTAVFEKDIKIILESIISGIYCRCRNDIIIR